MNVINDNERCASFVIHGLNNKQSLIKNKTDSNGKRIHLNPSENLKR